MSRHAKHRAGKPPIVWKYQRAMYVNRWYAFWKPRLKHKIARASAKLFLLLK